MTAHSSPLPLTDARLAELIEYVYDFATEGVAPELHSALAELRARRAAKEAHRRAVEWAEGKWLDEDFEMHVRAALETAWSDICADTGCHPPDIEHRGDELYFKPNHWTRFAINLMKPFMAAALISVHKAGMEKAAGIAERLQVTFARADGTRAEVMRGAIVTAIRRAAAEDRG